MKQPLLLHTLSAALLIGHAGIAIGQNAGERRVRIEITRNENGNESHVTREFDLTDERQLADALRELGVMDEMNIIGPDENLVIDLKRMREGGMLNDMSIALSQADALPGKPRPYLGVYYGDWAPSADKDEARKEPPVKDGAVITGIDEDTPAQKAGLRSGDVIVAMDGKPIRSGAALVESINAHAPGDRVELTYYRGKDKRTMYIELGAREDEVAKWDWNWNEGSNAYEEAMSAMADAFGEMEEQPFLGVDGDDMGDGQGVRITNVVDSSAAERMGLRNGDVVRSINGEDISDFEDLADRVSSMEPGEAITLEVERGGSRTTLNGALGRRRNMAWSFSGMPPMPPMPPMPDMPDMPEVDREAMRAEQRAARDEMRREMDELRREMDRLRRELRSEVTRETHVTVDAVRLSDKELSTLRGKGVAGLDKSLELSGLNLFPDPTEGAFSVSFAAPERGDLNVDIHNASGERIYHETITGFKGRYERVIDMSDREAGTYFVVITQNGRAVARKLVKG